MSARAPEQSVLKLRRGQVRTQLGVRTKLTPDERPAP
jgi:hypothetical protein